VEDWRTSLINAVPLWFEHDTNRKPKQAMIERVGSVDAIAAGTAEALTEIGNVVTAWLVDIPAPFHNSLIIEHESWMSQVSLLGAPKGILA
jgi:hypothetical protein